MLRSGWVISSRRVAGSGAEETDGGFNERVSGGGYPPLEFDSFGSKKGTAPPLHHVGGPSVFEHGGYPLSGT
jgi:hypothetical protein